MKQRRGPTWQPQATDYARIFEEQNPWHRTGEVPDVWAKEAERPIAGFLSERLRADSPRRYQLIHGPRRVGKTTSMWQAVRHLMAAGIPAKRLWWLRLDHPLLMQIDLGSLVESVLSKAAGAVTADQPIYLFLDELTYANRWDLWLKTFYDEGWPVVTVHGSSTLVF